MSIYSSAKIATFVEESKPEMPVEDNYPDLKPEDEAKIKESYTENDFGRILYEIEMNDMAFFEAVIKHDMLEINALKEGTLLEAEVEEANKKAKKSLLKKIAESFKTWWAKLKEVMSKAIANIQGELAKHKTLVASLKAAIKSIGGASNWRGIIPSVKLYGTVGYYHAEDAINMMKRDAHNCEYGFRDFLITLCRLNNEKPTANNAEEFRKEVFDKCYYTIQFKNSNIEDLYTYFDDSGNSIYTSKILMDQMNREIPAMISKLESENASESADYRFQNYKMLQTAYTAICRAVIEIDKLNVDTCVKVAKEAIADMLKQAAEDNKK